MILSTLVFVTLSLAGSNYAGTYEVPVTPELKPFAEYPLSKVQVKEMENGDSRISYELPLELTGVPNEIRFVGKFQPDGSGTFTGNSGSMVCSPKTDADPKCVVHYLSVQQNLDAVRLALQKFPLEEQAPRMQVAMAFGGDLEGFIRIQEAKEYR